ncbi:hypothetical protein BGY98DRAFT_1053654, partial [Russula aff. rugulosa BPL654]
MKTFCSPNCGCEMYARVTRKGGTRTWMSRWSDRQFSVVTSGLFEVRSCEQNLPQIY